MKTLHITFHPSWVRRLLGGGPFLRQAIFALVLACCCAPLAWVWSQARTLSSEREQLKAELAQARKAKPVQRQPTPVAQTAPAEALRQIDAATARLNIPWSALFEMVEQGAHPRVSLLSLEPDGKSGTVAVTAEARALEDLLSYAEALGRQKGVARVQLGKHEVRLQDPGQPVRMSLVIGQQTDMNR